MIEMVYQTKAEILKRGREAIGKTLGEIDSSGVLASGKGAIGNVVQESWFGIKMNSQSHPDFVEAGVELKVTPYEVTGNGFKAKERLVCNIIDYMQEHRFTFYNGSFWRKCNTMFLMFYKHRKDVAKNNFTIDEAVLFNFPERDLLIIIEDWGRIISKIKAGQAHMISEGDTFYLGACTKGATSTTLRKQPFSDILAMQRAFSLKQSYMTVVINDYVFGGSEPEYIVKDLGKLRSTGFEQYILGKVSPYIGRTQDSLKSEFKIQGEPKNQNELILARILGVKGKVSTTSEFRKANVVPKTVRINLDGSIKENMSFPAFDFKGIVLEEWKGSTLREMLVGTKFLFIIFRFQSDGSLVFDGIIFWNFPESDLEEVRKVWERTVATLERGVKTWFEGGKLKNDLPNSSENRVAHVRSHARDASDVAELPDGGLLTKQSFWLNRSYIKAQIELRLSQNGFDLKCQSVQESQ